MTYTALVFNKFVPAVIIDVIHRGNPIDWVIQDLVARCSLRVNRVLVRGIGFECCSADDRVDVVWCVFAKAENRVATLGGQWVTVHGKGIANTLGRDRRSCQQRSCQKSFWDRHSVIMNNSLSKTKFLLGLEGMNRVVILDARARGPWNQTVTTDLVKLFNLLLSAQLASALLVACIQSSSHRTQRSPSRPRYYPNKIMANQSDWPNLGGLIVHLKGKVVRSVDYGPRSRRTSRPYP